MEILLQEPRTLESGCSAPEKWPLLKRTSLVPQKHGRSGLPSPSGIFGWSGPGLTGRKAKELFYLLALLVGSQRNATCHLSMKCSQWVYQTGVWHPKMFVSRLIYPQFLPIYCIDRHLQYPRVFLNLIRINWGKTLSTLHHIYRGIVLKWFSRRYIYIYVSWNSGGNSKFLYM